MKNLALENRAIKFDDVVGQKEIVKGIRSKIVTNSLSNVLLFKGPTGTGKTTLAFLTAMALNCKNLQADVNPCCVCDSCKSIINQSFNRDVILFDGSTLSAKSEVIDLFSTIDSPPLFDKNKVIIIEEADQLSEGAKNSFLKIFERRLNNVYFILLSMKFKGIPDAIQSRCQVYNFSYLSIQELMFALKNLLEKENLWNSSEIPEDFKFAGLGLISSLAKGSLREAVQTLERCITEKIFDNEGITKIVQGVDEATVDAILGKIVKKDLSFVEDILEYKDFFEIYTLVYTFVQKVIIYAKTSYSSSTSDYFNKKLAYYANNHFPLFNSLLAIFDEIQKTNFIYGKSASLNFVLKVLSLLEGDTQQLKRMR